MSTFWVIVGVAIAGALGAPARYLVERAAHTAWPATMPWGTFVVNVSGSLALGIVAGLALAHGFDPDARTIVGTGFLGAYTTFSTYAYEGVRRAEEGHGPVATGYALGSVAAAVTAAALGLALTGAW